MTLGIIILTCLVSIAAFRNSDLMYKLQFNPYLIIHKKQWYRIVTHAFLHADYAHLAINMFVLYSFGEAIEYYFGQFFGTYRYLYYALLYMGSLIIAPVYALIRHRNNPNYNAVGASGAVSAVVFAAIFFNPANKIYFFAVLPIPGILFAILYLIYSYVMSKKSKDNVAHDTHFWGAVFGFFFPMLINPKLIQVFMYQITNIF